MANVNLTAFRVALVSCAAFALYTGLDQALGGFMTLGWLAQPSFFEIVDQDAFLVADNHQRFMGGIWGGLGLALLLCASDVEKYQEAIKIMFALVFVGGLARFSQGLEITLGPDILGALGVELVGMPALIFWLSRVVAKPGRAAAQ